MLQSLIWVKLDKTQPDNITLFDPGCLLLFNRDLNHKQHSWGASNEFCTGLGNNTRMVEIHTPDQRDALTMILSNVFSSHSNYNNFTVSIVDHNGLFYWVGATDQRHEGTWLWTSGEPVQDFVWMKSNYLPKIYS